MSFSKKTPQVALSSLSATERELVRFAGLVREAARARGLIERDVEEVLQDVRARQVNANASHEHDNIPSASHLQRVAMSAAVALLERRRRWQGESNAVAARGPNAPATLRIPSAHRSDDREVAEYFELALARLPRNRRLVVQLHLEGYAPHEIAGLACWPTANVPKLRARGLKDLRRAYLAESGAAHLDADEMRRTYVAVRTLRRLQAPTNAPTPDALRALVEDELAPDMCESQLEGALHDGAADELALLHSVYAGIVHEPIATARSWFSWWPVALAATALLAVGRYLSS